MNPEENRNPEDPLAAIERQTIADQLQSQREVLELEEMVLRRLMFSQPGLQVVTLAGGVNQPGGAVAEYTLPGDERDAWNGVYVENPGPYPVAIGFAAGGATGGAGYQLPPNTWKLIPVRYVTLSVGLVDPINVTGPPVRLTISRLRVPPIGVSSGPLTSVSTGGLDDTITTVGLSAVAPGGGSSVASMNNLPAGLYRVVVVSYQVTAPDANGANMRLAAGLLSAGTLPSTATPITTVFERLRVIPQNPAVLQMLGLTVITPGGAGSIYFGSIAATRIA